MGNYLDDAEERLDETIKEHKLEEGSDEEEE